MFVYTKNEYVKEHLEQHGCKLLQETENGVSIYVLSPTLSFHFEEYEDTWRSNTLTF